VFLMHALPPNQLSLLLHHCNSNRQQLQPRRPALCNCKCNPSISVQELTVVVLKNILLTHQQMQSLLQILPDRKKYIRLTQNTRYAVSVLTLGMVHKTAFQLMLLPISLPVSKCLNKLTNADIIWYSRASHYFLKAL
jgi:hypothetical protein